MTLGLTLRFILLTLLVFLVAVILSASLRPGASVVPSAQAASPSRWTAQPPEVFRPLPSYSSAVMTATPGPVATPKPKRTPRPALGHGQLIAKGVATMTDTRCAAAGPAVRIALDHKFGLHWRGQRVRVWFGARAADTWLCDWCACRVRPGGPTVIDLPPWMFRAFGQRPGVIPVRVELLR